MMDIKKVLLVSTAAVVLMTSIAGCDGNDNKENDIASSAASSEISSQAPRAEDLRKNVVGSWGRLGEVMHSFYNDNTCVIGGMFGEYEIKDDLTLVLTTTSGTVTEYHWNDKTGDYWRVEDDILTVNGNQFTKISDEPETLDGLS